MGIQVTPGFPCLLKSTFLPQEWWDVTQICIIANLTQILALHYLMCPKRCLRLPRLWNRFGEEK